MAECRVLRSEFDLWAVEGLRWRQETKEVAEHPGDRRRGLGPSRLLGTAIFAPAPDELDPLAFSTPTLVWSFVSSTPSDNVQ